MLTFSPKKNTSLLLITLLISTFLLTACTNKKTITTHSDPAEITQTTEIDPYEEINRKIFSLNQKADKYVIKPITDAYVWITPQFVRSGVTNFFNNLKDINVVLNDVLQGKWQQGGEDLIRLYLNTTFGLGGILDVASREGLPKHEEDFAQTFAVWGIPSGPYLMMPLLGPATSRGIPGHVLDSATNPASYASFPIRLIESLNDRASATGLLKFTEEAALDSYIFIRESFLQHRRHLITDGKSEIADDVMEVDFYNEDIYLLDDQ